jgi:hypothetical protein
MARAALVVALATGAACGGGAIATRDVPSAGVADSSGDVDAGLEDVPAAGAGDAATSAGPPTGWGTIGTGRYGASGQDRRGPQVQLGAMSCVGGLHHAIVRRYVKRDLAKVIACYERQLAVTPGVEGTVGAELVIGPDGAVTSAVANGVGGEVSTCIGRVIEAIAFPRPSGGGSVQCNLPLTLRPAPI